MHTDRYTAQNYQSIFSDCISPTPILFSERFLCKWDASLINRRASMASGRQRQFTGSYS